MKIHRTIIFVFFITISFMVSGQPKDSTHLLITTNKGTYASNDTVWVSIKNISADSIIITSPYHILAGFYLERFENAQWVDQPIGYPCNQIIPPLLLVPGEEITVSWDQSQVIKDHWPQREQAPSGQYRFHLGFGFTSHYYYVRHQDNVTIMQDHFLGCSSTFNLIK
jgi:hypothetical protein